MNCRAGFPDQAGSCLDAMKHVSAWYAATWCGEIVNESHYQQTFDPSDLQLCDASQEFKLESRPLRSLNVLMLRKFFVANM